MIVKKPNQNLLGFQDLHFSKEWRISHLSYNKHVNDVHALHMIERHLETEEVFVLLTGKASLISGGKDSKVESLTVERLQEGTIYLIEQGEWHVAVLTEGTELLIIENAKDSVSESLPLSRTQLLEIESYHRLES